MARCEQCGVEILSGGIYDIHDVQRIEDGKIVVVNKLMCEDCAQEYSRGKIGFKLATEDQKEKIVPMNFVEKVKGFLTEPSKTFDALKEYTLENAMVYFIGLVAIFMGMVFLAMLSDPSVRSEDITEAMLLPVGLIIAPFIIGSIIHIGVYIVGGRKGISQTIKAYVYAQTPVLILGLGLLTIVITKMENVAVAMYFISVIWSFVLLVFGIRQLQEISTGRVVASYLITVVIIIFTLGTINLMLN